MTSTGALNTSIILSQSIVLSALSGIPLAQRYAVTGALDQQGSVLAVGGLFAIWLDPSTPSKSESATYTLLTMYMIHSLATLLLVWRPKEFTPGWGLAGHAFDLAVFAIIIYALAREAARIVIQVLLVAALCVWPVFRLMGRDYEGAVISSGFCGFMLGTTANAMANMEALVERYGLAPRAFLVVPMVGAFFIDFTNALIITGFVNVLR